MQGQMAVLPFLVPAAARYRHYCPLRVASAIIFTRRGLTHVHRGLPTTIFPSSPPISTYSSSNPALLGTRGHGTGLAHRQRPAIRRAELKPGGPARRRTTTAKTARHHPTAARFLCLYPSKELFCQ